MKFTFFFGLANLMKIELIVLKNSGPPITVQLGLGHLTVCMQNKSQLVGDDQDKVQNFQVGLLLHVVGDILYIVGDPLRVVEYRLVWGP